MTAQEKIWKVIRGLGEFTVDDVVILTGLQRTTVSVYLSTIHKAGYLRISAKKGYYAVYRIVRNTGAKAPLQRRCVYDPNTKETLLIKVKEGQKCLKSSKKK